MREKKKKKRENPIQLGWEISESTGEIFYGSLLGMGWGVVEECISTRPINFCREIDTNLKLQGDKFSLVPFPEWRIPILLVH